MQSKEPVCLPADVNHSNHRFKFSSKDSFIPVVVLTCLGIGLAMAQFARILQNCQNINHFLGNPGVGSYSGVSRLQAGQSGNRDSVPCRDRYIFFKAFRPVVGTTQPAM